MKYVIRKRCAQKNRNFCLPSMMSKRIFVSRKTLITMRIW